MLPETTFSSTFYIPRRQKTFYSLCLMLLFWCLFDGLLAYLLPLLITDLGYSKTQMGLIIASSNVFGAIFDFLLAKFLVNTNYRRLFLLVFGLSALFPLILWSSKTIPLFLLGMAVWGLYGDLNNFATFDFISRRSRHSDHSQSFGIISVFRNLGYLIAPIIAGLIVVNSISFFPYALSLSFIFISFIFYLILIELSPKKDSPRYDHTLKYSRYNFFKELKLISKISKILLPVLIFNILIYLFDSVFWTIGPLFSQSFINFRDFGGLFMTAYTLPILIVNWFVKPFTSRFGQKKTAYYSFFFGCLLLLPITFVKNPYLIILFVFLSSLVNSLAWPSIRGAYADYISESHLYQKEIEALNDFTFNLGYIIGPATAGIFADLVGINNLFLILIFFSLVTVLILLQITPRQINVVVSRH